MQGRNSCRALAGMMVLAIAAPAAAQVRTFDIPAQAAWTGVPMLGRQADVQIGIARKDALGRRTNMVRGSMSVDRALAELLQGTGLRAIAIGSQTYSVVRSSQDPGSTPRANPGAPAADVASPAPGSNSAHDTPLTSPGGEIIVTAQRRTEPLRQVPQSASVLTGSELSRAGLQSLQDLATRVPGLTIDSAGGVGQQQITLRGITTGSDVGPTVGTYIDDVPFGSAIIFSGSAQLALELGSFDVDRIEILRGPQGTLYGASAFGGVLKYVLTQPSTVQTDGVAQMETSVTEGGGLNYGTRAAAGVALVPGKLGVRATFSRNRSAGLVDNVFDGRKNVDDSVTSVGRLSLLYTPTDALTIRATALFQDIDRDGASQVDYDPATSRPTYGDLKQSRLRAEPFNQRVRLFSGGLDYRFGFATLSATAARQSIDTTYALDFSYYVPLLGPLLEELGSPTDAIELQGTYRTDKTTMEARLVSPTSGSFEWLAGIYRTKEESVNFQGLFGFENNRPINLDIGRFTIPVSLEETALYADATYHFSTRLDSTLGVRLSRNRQTFAQTGTGLLGSSNPGGASNDTVATYLATLRYHLADGGIVYARAASGYRPGGPNLVAFAPGTTNIIGNPTYAPDTLWNYEVGAKVRLAPWLDLDSSLFYIDWRNIQLFKTENGLSVVGNGKRARSKGAELSVTGRPFRGWSVQGALAYTDAELRDAAPDLGGAAGERLPNVPRWNVVLSGTHDWPLGPGARGYFGANWRFVGQRKAAFDAAGSGQYVLPAYQAVDLRAGAKLSAWNIDLTLRNLFNRRGQAAADLGATGFGYPAAVTVIQPRSAFLIVTREF